MDTIFIIMYIIFMNFKNRETSEPLRLLVNFTDKIIFKKVINMRLYHLSIYYTWKNIKKSYKNSKFKISALTCGKRFDLPNGSYSASDIQDYFEYIIKNMKQLVIILQ